MKQKFNNSELAHIYAAQSQEGGQNANGSLYFHNYTIYSYGYHFPIASIVPNGRGEEIMLFTTRTYSNTTAKHINIVQQATSHYKKLYCSNPCGSHDENLKAWILEAGQHALALAKAKKPQKYIQLIEEVKNSVREYLDFFALDMPNDLQDIFNIENKTEYLQYADKKAEFAKAEAARKLKQQKKEYKEQLKKWLDGETSRLYTRLDYDFLRLNDNRVETTQAVQIPLEIAKRLYNSIKAETIKEGDKILNYTIDKVGSEISIGCHKFTKAYLLRFGASL